MNLEAIAHKIIAVTLAEATINDTETPVIDGIKTHANVLGQKVVGFLGQLKRAERDSHSDDEDGFLVSLVIIPQRRHLDGRVAADL